METRPKERKNSSEKINQSNKIDIIRCHSAESDNVFLGGTLSRKVRHRQITRSLDSFDNCTIPCLAYITVSYGSVLILTILHYIVLGVSAGQRVKGLY